MTLTDIQQFFDHQAPTWDYSFDEQKLTHLKDLFAQFVQRLQTPILDLGCGTGVLLKVFPQFLVEQQGMIVELDIAWAMLNQVKPKMNDLQAKVCRIQADGHVLPFVEQSFKEVVAFQVFPHFTHPQHVTSEVARILKPGGRFIILHLMDHFKLNELHRNAGQTVANHYLPPVSELGQQLQPFGFTIEQHLEKEDCYLIVARKNW